MATIDPMEEFMRRYEEQLRLGAEEYVLHFRNNELAEMTVSIRPGAVFGLGCQGVHGLPLRPPELHDTIDRLAGHCSISSVNDAFADAKSGRNIKTLPVR